MALRLVAPVPPGHKRWHDDPPVGTIVFLDNGNAEVYAGHGNWHTVDTDALNECRRLGTALVQDSPLLDLWA